MLGLQRHRDILRSKVADRRFGLVGYEHPNIPTFRDADTMLRQERQRLRQAQETSVLWFPKCEPHGCILVARHAGDRIGNLSATGLEERRMKSEAEAFRFHVPRFEHIERPESHGNFIEKMRHGLEYPSSPNSSTSE